MSKKGIAVTVAALILVLLVVVLWSVKKEAPWPQDILRQSDDIDYGKLATTTVAFRLDQVLEQAGPRPDLDMVEQREFDVYLERPDLKLKQPENPEGDKYTSDLRPELRPVGFLVSEISDHTRDGGNSCDFGGFPTRCTLNLSAKEQGQPKTVLLKIVFADKTYAEKEFVVPYAGMLKEPEILAPKTLPQNGEAMRLKFKDVGADDYKIGVHLCHPYQNNGINPCLKGVDYTVSREGDHFVWRYLQEPPSQKDITLKNGAVDIILPAQYNFSDEDTSVVYRVSATLSGTTGDGIKTYLTSGAEWEIKR